MSTFKKMLLAFLLFAIAVFFILRSNFTDIQINKYPDMDIVKQEKAIEHGWIPAILPDSAYKITETHDIDTNDIFGSFDYKEKDIEGFKKHLTVVPDMNKTYIWEDFLFKIDSRKREVKFRNRPKNMNGKKHKDGEPS